MDHNGLDQLVELLGRLFDAGEFRRHLESLRDGPRLVRELVPAGGCERELMGTVVGGLERRGLLDAYFFQRLLAERPQRGPEIEAVRALCITTCDLPGVPPKPRTLPTRPAHFVRRAELEDRLLAALRTTEMACASIHGLDGLGKSTLLRGIAWTALSSLGERARLLFYSPERRAELSLAQIQGDLERAQGRQSSAADTSEASPLWWEEALTDSLAALDEVWIVIYDFHVLVPEEADNAELEALLVAIPERLRAKQAGTRLRIVVASSEALSFRVAGEVRLTRVELDPMTPEEAVQLLTKLDVGGPSDRGSVLALAEHAERIPSRLVQIATYVRQERISAARALTELRERAPAKDPQRDLLNQSYERLTPSARAVLDALTVFSGPVTPVTLFAACELPSEQVFRESLAELERRLMISVAEGSCAIPMFLRNLLAERLSDEERRRLHRRAAGALLRGPRAQDWKSVEDASHALACLEHLLAAEDWDGAYKVYQNIHDEGLGRLGLHQLRADLGSRLAEHLEDSPSRAATCLRSGAYGCMRLGRYEEARESVERAEGLALEAEDWQQMYFCLNAYGNIALNERRMEEACEQYQRALDYVNRYGLPAYHQAVGLANIGECLCHIGDFAGAATRSDAVLELFMRHVRPWKRQYLRVFVSTWRYRAQIHLAMGDPESARYCADTAIALARGSEALWHLGAGLIVRGEIDLVYPNSSDPLDVAVRSFEEAVELLRRSGMRVREGIARFHLGRAYHLHGRIKEARHVYEEAQRMKEDASHGEISTYLGMLELAEGRESFARQRLREGASTCRRLLRKSSRLYESLYTLAFARLGETLLAGRRGKEAQADVTAEATVAAYRAALAVTAAPGVRAAALGALALVPAANAGHPLVEQIRNILLAAGEPVDQGQDGGTAKPD